MGILLILLGIIGVIINANGWFIMPQLVINILFILIFPLSLSDRHFFRQASYPKYAATTWYKTIWRAFC